MTTETAAPVFTIHHDSRTTEHNRTLRRDGILLGTYDFSPASGDWFATAYVGHERPVEWHLSNVLDAQDFITTRHGIPPHTPFLPGKDEAELYQHAVELGRTKHDTRTKEQHVAELNEHDETRADAIREAFAQLRDAGLDEGHLLEAAQLLARRSAACGRTDQALNTVRLELEQSH